MKSATPWIYSKRFDLCAIIGPPLVVSAIVLIWGRQIAQISETPWWLWVLLVLGIDVAHVYSSLWRTYFDKEEFARRRTLYISVPLLCWAGGMMLYLLGGAGPFWLVVAYGAIYHFVRQQYGFMMLYRRGEPTNDFGYRIDQSAIYLATIYPLVFWHTHPREFQWFSEFKMPYISWPWLEPTVRVIYILVLLAFVAKEMFRFHKSRSINAGKCLLLGATALSWYAGIVLFNGDLTFTLINIVSHGIPYMALVWIYQFRKTRNPSPNANILRFFQLKYVPMYVLSLVAFAFVEEGIWDWFVWKEHPNLFGPSHFALGAGLLSVVVPLLTTPQLTHYVLDGFIWRVNKKGGEEIRSVIG